MNSPYALPLHDAGVFASKLAVAAATLMFYWTGPDCLAADAPQAPSVFYVAPNGRDQWSGTVADPTPAGADGPFATLARARDAVRQLKAKSGGRLPGPVNVFVRGGKYFLPETLVLGPEESGTRQSPVLFAAYRGEKPILSGARRIAGWQPYKEKVWQAPVPEAKGGKWKFSQLFSNGRRQVRARYPNADPKNPWRTGWLPIEGPAEPESYVAFKYKAGSLPRRWAKPTQGEAFVIMDWGYTTITPIQKIDEKNRAITMTGPVRNFAQPPWGPTFKTHFGFGIPFRFYVENLIEELDQPGEWCLDSEEGKVYFWPPEGAAFPAEVTAPVLDCLVALRGASWVAISGLTFTETADGGDNMHRLGYEGSGAMFPMNDRKYCGEALHLKGAEHCRIAANRFLEVGGNAVYLEDYNYRNVIQSNEIAYAGHCGVGLIGKRHYDGVPHHPLGNEILDNFIHHCGVFDKVAPGVFCGVSDANLIGHNLIEEMPHHAINLGNHGYGRNIVEYNRVRFTCRETFDNAAINCWMENDRTERGEERSGHVFRYNLISDTAGPLTFGLYLDNHSSNCFVYGNIIVRSGTSGIRINGGKNNLVENNVIVGGSQEGISFWNPGASLWPQMKAFMTGNRLVRNIICRSDSKPLYLLDDRPEDVSRAIIECDWNVYFNPAAASQTPPGASQTTAVAGQTIVLPGRTLSLKQWQAEGHDEHSIVADPLFVDPAKDDYRLKPESPALKLGFHQIDPTPIGPRQPPP